MTYKVSDNYCKTYSFKKYGDNFGTILSKIIMEDYLAVKDNTTEWFLFGIQKSEHPCFCDTTSDELRTII